MSNYVHFYWAGNFPTPDVLNQFYRWSQHLGSQFLNTPAMPIAGKTQFIPVLWCSEKVFDEIAQHEILPFDGAELPIPSQWNHSYAEFKKELAPLQEAGHIDIKKACYWVSRRTVSGANLAVHMFAINIEAYLLAHVPINPAFKTIHTIYCLFNENGQYTTSKNNIMILLLKRHSGFYFDIDNNPSLRPFLMNKNIESFQCEYERVKALFKTKEDVVFSNIRFTDPYDIEGSDIFSDVNMLFCYRGCSYSALRDNDKLTLFIFNRTLKNGEFHKALSQYINDKKMKESQRLQARLLSDNARDRAKAQEEFFRLFSQYQRNSVDAMQNFPTMASKKANDFELRRSFASATGFSKIFLLPVDYDDDALGHILSDEQHNAFKSYEEFFNRFIAPLFELSYAKEPSSFLKTGYQTLQRHARAISHVKQHLFNNKLFVLDTDLLPMRVDAEMSIYCFFDVVFFLQNDAWLLEFESYKRKTILLKRKRNPKLSISITFSDYHKERGNIFSVKIDNHSFQQGCRQIRVLSSDEKLTLYYQNSAEIESLFLCDDCDSYPASNFASVSVQNSQAPINPAMIDEHYAAVKKQVVIFKNSCNSILREYLRKFGNRYDLKIKLPLFDIPAW